MNLRNPLSWLSNGFGSGLSPVAPGTVGSFLALLIYYFLFYENIDTFKQHLFFIIFILISFFIGLFIYPRTVGEDHDPGSFVWDEFVGMWIACIPLALIDHSLKWLFISFISFRIFDIWKPFGIKFLDNKTGAFYVMIDDVLAGLLAAILVTFLSIFLI